MSPRARLLDEVLGKLRAPAELAIDVIEHVTGIERDGFRIAQTSRDRIAAELRPIYRQLLETIRAADLVVEPVDRPALHVVRATPRAQS